MNIFKIMAGKILYYIAKIISFILDIFIGIIEIIVGFVVNIARGFIALIGFGGCFFLLLFAGPLGITLLLNPFTLLIVMFFIIFPILGTKFVSSLRYMKYMVTEYLYDRADYLLEGKKNRYQTFNEYGNKYKRMQEEEYRRKQKERQEQQQREWEEKFRQWNEYQSSQKRYSEYRTNWGYNQNQDFGNGQPFINPSIEFKRKYETSCDLLSVPYNTDIYQIKLAYRKKAKQYHPDINKSTDATKLFQEINDAYEFLSEGNIERYKNMN